MTRGENVTEHRPHAASPADMADRIVLRIEELAGISEREGEVTRVAFSPEHRRAADLILGWMREAGMAARQDEIGNVVGRYEGAEPGAPALMTGSHYDTVRNAGKWDGPLGVVTAIECVAALSAAGTRLPHAIEVVGFCDEEGVRFSSTLLGSRAVAGTFDEGTLEAKDAQGVSVRAAMTAFGLDPARVGRAARRRADVLAYLELHIEQGPVLEAENLPVGVVTAISGANRFRVELEGMAGHAGTVPMTLRRDALAGAAECVLAVEALAREGIGVVGTVGQIEALPGATNVIPGRAVFTIDIRAADDVQRRETVSDVVDAIDEIAARRGLKARIIKTHENGTARCAPWLQAQLAAAIAGAGHRVLELPSGAGHDGMAMIDLTDIAMIFVRCRGGISHHPAEHVSAEDVAAGAAVLLSALAGFRAR
ncbi:allantoate amidohydrolase [Xanthobacter sediminis]|uniref:allantoate amidohydrolase n=1 Tax=Xanthobacter sediminis TaxID=3119926 RepID=UPI0037277DF3